MGPSEVVKLRHLMLTRLLQQVALRTRPFRSGREKITAKWVWIPGFCARPLQHS